MTPKSETMLMAWHPKFGYNQLTSANTKKEVIKTIDHFRMKDYQPIQVTIQPKKRGK